MTFAEETTFLGVLSEGHRVRGACLRNRSGESEVRSAVTIGADGIGSRAARSVGAVAYDERPGATAFRYAYYDGVAKGAYEFWRPGRRPGGIVPDQRRGRRIYAGLPAEREAELRAEPGFDRVVAAAASSSPIASATATG